MPAEPSLLIVEEDAEQLDALARGLLELGFRVTAVRHPRQALAAAAQRLFHIAILGRSLPERTGVDLMHMLQRRTANLQVILLAGCAKPCSERELREIGALACFCQPYTIAQIRDVIEAALSARVEPRESECQPAARPRTDKLEQPQDGVDSCAWAEWF